jgi:hypothetical protein
LAALAGAGYPQPVWHCSVRSAPEDRMLSDHEWAQVAARVMDRTGIAPAGDDLGVRWVAVRHVPDHIHLVATLARQDGDRPTTWNDFYRVRDACRDAERRFGPPEHCSGGSHRHPARHPVRDGTGDPARVGRGAPRHAPPRGIHGRRRIRNGAGVLRPAAQGRGLGAQAV